MTLAAQASKGATVMLHDQADLPVRLANAAIAYAKYLAMTVWPADLAVYYPYDFQPSPWQTAGAALLLLAVTGGVRLVHPPGALLGRRLALVFGHARSGDRAGAGRFPGDGRPLLLHPFHRPLPGLRLGRGRSGKMAAVGRNGYAGCARRAISAILAAFLVATHLQASYWVNSERLFRHALAITGENPVACENLGDALLHQGRYAEAEVQFRKVLAMDAEHYRQTPPELAQALAGQGRIGDANRVRAGDDPRRTPTRAAAMNNLALFLAHQRQNHMSEAIQLLARGNRDRPPATRGVEEPCLDLCHLPGPPLPRRTEGRRTCPAGLRVSGWNDAACRQTLADAYVEAGDLDHAIEELRAVVQLNPHDPAAARQLESVERRR